MACSFIPPCLQVSTEVSLSVWISDGYSVPPAPGFLLLQSRCQPPPAFSSLSEGELELTKSGKIPVAGDVKESHTGWGKLCLARLIDDDKRIVKWMGSLVPKALRGCWSNTSFQT